MNEKMINQASLSFIGLNLFHFLVAKGFSPKEAISEVYRLTGVKRNV